MTDVILRNLHEAGPNMQCIITVRGIIHARENRDIAITYLPDIDVLGG